MRTTTVVFLLLAVCGCGKRDESIAKKVGEKVGETATDFATGAGRGIDKQLLVQVELSESATAQGLTTTVAKSAASDDQHVKAITVYVIAKNALKGQLLAKAFNKDGQEIGRATEDVEFTADDAKYVTFKFQKELDTQLVQKYLIEVRK